jgi:antirestriction protein ArdC/phage/plasmid primase-like uncharacterized protein
MTYKQAAGKGYQVKKGEKGQVVQYWKFNEKRDKLDENGKPVRYENGKKVQVTVQLDKPKCFHAVVFNAQQMDGVPALEKREYDWNPNERAEAILKGSNADIRHQAGDRAYYSPVQDHIVLPEKTQFQDEGKYYATALHELGHWTGHGSRLDRDLSGPFGSESYAKEELRAEISSMMVGAEIGTGHDPGQHVAYVGSWIKALEEDPNEIVRAARDAEQIMEYVLGLEQEIDLEQEKNQEPEKSFKDLTQTHDDVLAVITEQHQTAIEGYSALESWENLKQVASEHGVEAGLRWAEDDHFTPAEVVYSKDGKVLPVTSDFSTGDGKAVTLVDGERISGTGLTSDTEWQRDALKAGIEKALELESILENLGQLTEPYKDLPDPEREANMSDKRTYINVDYKERAEAKALGAKWDGRDGVKSWFVPPGVETKPFEKWMGDKSVSEDAVPAKAADDQALATEKTFLAVPYEARNDAKALGAKWDKEAKSWYAPEGVDMTGLKKWIPENIQEGKEIDPREEFAKALEDAGFILKDDHPRMDGKLHRLETQQGSRGNQNGAYKGFLDGHPAGFIENHATGEKTTWKASGVTLSPEERAKIQAEAAEKKQLREAETMRKHQHHARRCEAAYNLMKPATQENGYLKEKGVSVPPGAREDKRGRLVIPLRDQEGKIWSLQRIGKSGFKSMKKGAKKSGNSFVMGDKDLNKAEAILITEGVATGASVHMATGGMPVVVAFDAGNLNSVANSLKESYPDKEIVILGDDDRHMEGTKTGNRGRADAEKVAQKVGGNALFPQFGKGESGKEFKDWNDLHKARGLETVKRQVTEGLDRIKQRRQVEQQKQKEKQREQVQERGGRSQGISR